MQDIRGHGVDFCKDQFGSRFIQTKLVTATEEEVRKPISVPCLPDVCADKGAVQAQAPANGQRKRLAASHHGGIPYLQ